MLDHFGWAGGRRLPGLAAFAPLLRQLEAGRVWVKLSAAYQICGGATDCPEAAELAARLLTANPQRILFASNWPHVGQSLTIGLPSLVATTRAWAASLGVEPEGIFGNSAERLYQIHSRPRID